MNSKILKYQYTNFSNALKLSCTIPSGIFIMPMQAWFNIQKFSNVIYCINEMNEKKRSSQLMQKKDLTKLNISWLNKTLNKVEIEGNYLRIIKTIREKFTSIITFNYERLKAFSSKIKKTTTYAFSILVSRVLEVLVRKIRLQREIKGIRIWKEEV